MDNFLDKIERLSELAAARRDPRPMDAASIVAGVHGLEIQDDSQIIPLGFLTGGAAAAAAAAIVVSALAFMGWNDYATSLPSVETLLDISDMLL